MTELRKRGVAAAVICSDAFLELAKTQTRVLGVPELPLITVEHPLGGLSIEHVEGRAHATVSQVIELIKKQSSQ